jgi:hypothetical protein
MVGVIHQNPSSTWLCHSQILSTQILVFSIVFIQRTFPLILTISKIKFIFHPKIHPQPKTRFIQQLSSPLFFVGWTPLFFCKFANIVGPTILAILPFFSYFSAILLALLAGIPLTWKLAGEMKGIKE